MQYHISSMPRPIAEKHHGQHTLTIECVAFDRGNARKPGALGSTSQKVSHCINDFLVIFTNRPLGSGRNLSRDLPARGNSTSMSVSKALIREHYLDSTDKKTCSLTTRRRHERVSFHSPPQGCELLTMRAGGTGRLPASLAFSVTSLFESAR
jgi:hypothetical protein